MILPKRNISPIVILCMTLYVLVKMENNLVLHRFQYRFYSSYFVTRHLENGGSKFIYFGLPIKKAPRSGAFLIGRSGGKTRSTSPKASGFDKIIRMIILDAAQAAPGAKRRGRAMCGPTQSLLTCHFL
jgi:hypothetical protein